jgi:hypothetical protein
MNIIPPTIMKKNAGSLQALPKKSEYVAVSNLA